MSAAGELAERIAGGLLAGDPPDTVAAELLRQAGPDMLLYITTLVSELPASRDLPRGFPLLVFVVASHRAAFGRDHLSVAWALQQLASQYENWARYAEAAAALEEACRICAAMPGSQGLATCLANLGLIRSATGEYDLAADLLGEALARHQADPAIDPREIMHVMRHLALAERYRGRLPAAMAWSEDLVAVSRAAFGDDSAEAALALIALAELVQEAGAAARSEALCAEALQVLRAMEDDPLAWPAFHELGRVWMEAGNGRGSLAALRAASRLAESALGKDHGPNLQLSESFADWSLRFGPAIAAKPIYAALLDACEHTVGIAHPDVAALLAKLARVEAALGDADGAREKLRRALSIQETALGARHPSVAETLEQLAAIALERSDFAAAGVALERALALRREGASAVRIARPLAGLATLRAELDDHEDALRLQREALDILTCTAGREHPETAEANSRLAVILGRCGEWAQAEAYLGVALAMRRQALGSVFGTAYVAYAESLRDLGAIRAAQGDHRDSAALFAEAEDYAARALGPLHPDVARARLGQAAAQLSLGDRDAACALAAQSYAILAGHPRPEIEWRATALLADIAETAGRPKAAILFGKLAVDRLQQIHSTLEPLGETFEAGYLRGRAATYHLLADRLVRAGRLPEAQAVMALLKSAELRAGLRAGPRHRSVVLSPEEAEWRAEGDSIRAVLGENTHLIDSVGDGIPALAHHQAEVGQLEGERQELHQLFMSWIGGLFRPETAGKPGISAAVAAAKPPPAGIAALDFILSEARLHIVLTLADGQSSRSVDIDEATVGRCAYRFWTALRDKSPDYLDVAQTLYRYLIEPVAAALSEAGVRTLSISADGPLRYVAFSALHDGTAFLVERYAVTLRAMAVEEKATTPGSGAALFGATLRRPGLLALSSVRQELAAVARAVGSETTYIDNDFTAEQLSRTLAAGPAILHVASHFVFLPAREMESWLLLGDGTKLTVAELLSNRYPLTGITLMVLSACETALSVGKRGAGREIESLPAALLDAGAGAVLASLWPADDVSTAALMPEFYRLWRKDGLEMAEALQQAQIALIPFRLAGTSRGLKPDPEGLIDAPPSDKRPHPHQWANFVLTIPAYNNRPAA